MIKVAMLSPINKGEINTNNVSMVTENPRSDTQSFHDDSGIPWLNVQRKINCCVQAFKLTNVIGPSALTAEFEPKIGNRLLRSSDTVVHDTPRTVTKFAERDFMMRSKEYWKHLTADIQMKPSVSSFKNALKGTPIFGHVR